MRYRPFLSEDEETRKRQLAALGAKYAPPPPLETWSFEELNLNDLVNRGDTSYLCLQLNECGLPIKSQRSEKEAQRIQQEIIEKEKQSIVSSSLRVVNVRIQETEEEKLQRLEAENKWQIEKEQRKEQRRKEKEESRRKMNFKLVSSVSIPVVIPEVVEDKREPLPVYVDVSVEELIEYRLESHCGKGPITYSISNDEIYSTGRFVPICMKCGWCGFNGKLLLPVERWPDINEQLKLVSHA